MAKLFDWPPLVGWFLGLSFGIGFFMGVCLMVLVHQNPSARDPSTSLTLESDPPPLTFHVPEDHVWDGPPNEGGQSIINPDFSGPGWTRRTYDAPSGTRYILPIPPGTCERSVAPFDGAWVELL